MDNPLLKHTLQKFREGRCTDQEIEQLHRWLDALEAESTAEEPSEAELAQLRQQSLSNLLPALNQSTTRPLWIHYGRMAAAILVVLAAVGYFILKNPFPGQITLATGKQQIQRVTLPDGSTVWLHAGTTLRYTEPFVNEKRQVDLVGQAFFDVKRDTLHPFVVNTYGTTTTVLGTSFSINAYPQSPTIRVAVATGKVKVSTPEKKEVLLTPANRVTVQKKGLQTHVDTIAIAQIKSWTTGEISLQNATLGEVLSALEQYYGVNFQSHLKTEEGNFTLKLNQKLSLDQALEIIQTVSYQPKIRFEKREKAIHVYRSPT